MPSMTHVMPSPEDLGLIRHGAEVAQMKPFLDAEIISMQKAVVSSVLTAVNSGTLTPDIALSKWMEYVAYQKLTQRFDQRIRVGASVGASRNLDIKD